MSYGFAAGSGSSSGAGLGGPAAAPIAGFGLKLHVPARTTDNGLGQDVKPSTAPAPHVQTAESRQDVHDKATAIWSRLVAAQDSSIPGRMLATEFMYLPSAELYPDYYNVIGNKAIALSDVKRKIDAYHYTALAQAKADFAQIFDNAKAYNQKGSQIYLDAKKLKKLMRSTYSELTGVVDPADNEESKPVTASPSRPAQTVPPPQPASSNHQAPQIPVQTGPVTLETTQVLLPDNIPGTTYATRGPTIKPWLNRKIAELLALADKQTGRFLSSQFQVLPPKSDWPEYYRAVPKPLSFDQISLRNHRRKYETVQSFVDDVKLLLQNALSFHPENTQPWRDAKLLELHFAEVMKEKPPDFLPPRKYNTTKRRLGLDTDANQPEEDARAAKRPRRDDSESVMPESDAGDQSDGSDSETDSEANNANGDAQMLNGHAFVDGNAFDASAAGTPAMGSPLGGGMPDLPALPDLPPGGSSFLHPDLLGYSGSPDAFSPLPNGSPAPSIPPPDLSKPQLVAKSNNRAPLITRFFVSTAPQTFRQTILTNGAIRQHSISVPVRTERVDITIVPAPVYKQQPVTSSNGTVNGHSSHSLSISTNTRPKTVALVPSNNNSNVYSFAPRLGLTVVEFIVKPHPSVQDSDADVYRCFVQRG
ncbi:hypothetical protein ACM66B_001505 [Microbotryomycetes sp. NB124-2]